MSSRALRRLREEQELSKVDAISEEEEDDEESITDPSKKTVFAMFDDDSESDSDSESEEETDKEDAVVRRDVTATVKTDTNNSDKGKEEEEDIDAILDEFRKVSSNNDDGIVVER